MGVVGDFGLVQGGVYYGLDFFYSLGGFGFGGGFGDDSHDGFGVAGSGVDPAGGPVDSDAVLGVDFFVGEGFFDGFDGFFGGFAGALELGFQDFVAGDLGYEL